MADNSMNGNHKSRCLLAPHPWPLYPLDYRAETVGSAPILYLSWPGWELYLRRLGLSPAPDGPAPLLLPDLLSPEQDCAAIDQLVKTAGELGAAVLNLSRKVPDSLPALTGAIANYPAAKKTLLAGPLLDDRSYLALWAVNEYQARQTRSLLDEAAVRQEAMWAALKGETEAAGGGNDFPPPAAEADPRTAYAWRCWRRLAEPLLTPADIILPTAPPAE